METNVSKLENVRKSCKVGSIVCKVLQIVLIVTLAIGVGGLITLVAMRTSVNEAVAANPEIAQNMTMSVGVSNVVFSPDLGKASDEGEFAEAAIAVLSVAMVIVVLALVIISLIRKIFTSILQSDSPFDDIVLKSLKRVCIVAVIMAVISSGVGEGLIVAMICWCIYTIFQYGAELQKQSDETL